MGLAITEEKRWDKMSKGYVYQEIGRRIRELRGRDRQKDWAVRLGCDQGYISQVENGVTKPSLAFLKGVSSITNSSIDWILTGKGDKSSSGEAAARGADLHALGSGSGGDDILTELKQNPKLLLGVDRLLKLKGGGRRMLEAFHDMDEDRLMGLAAFMGANRK
jgi:transcriptional regulator with XRE-family HTH domain